MYMEMHTSKAASDGVQQSSWSGFGRTFLVNLLYMHMYMYVLHVVCNTYMYMYMYMYIHCICTCVPTPRVTDLNHIS